MEKTTTEEAPARTDKLTPPLDERARAKAYLDLWERHLVLTAMEDPVPRWVPARP